MAYTGVDFYNDLQIRTNQGSAAAFLSTDRANYFAKQAIVSLVQENYRSITEQTSVDEISPLIQTYKTFVPYNGQVLLKPLDIIKIEYQTVDDSDYLLITFNRPHNFDFDTYPSGIKIAFYDIVGTGDFSALNNTSVIVTEDTITNNPNAVKHFLASTTSATYTRGGIAIPDNITIPPPNLNALGGNWVYDYYNYLSCKLEYTENLGLEILGIDNKLGQFVMTIGTNNNIRTGEYLNFTGFGGLTIGNKYVKKIAYNKIKLYNDEKLKTPYVNVNTYTSGGVITRTSTLRSALPYPSDFKNDVYLPTPRYPLFETNENRLKIYPNEGITQTKYVLDYIKQFYEIDVENNTTDLHYYYNALFCTKIIERSAQMFFAMVSSGEDIQIGNVIGGNL
jgi:hypothetical protein